MTCFKHAFKHAGASLFAIVVLSSAAGSAQADERFQIGMGGGARFVPMESMDALSASPAYGAVSLDGSVALPELVLLPGYQTEVGLGWEFGELNGTTFHRIDSTLELDTVTVSGRLQRGLVGPVSAFAQARLGLQWGRLQLRDGESSNARPLQGSAKALVTGVGSGFEVDLTSGKAQAFHIGLRFDATYLLATSMSFTGAPASGGDDELRLQTQATELGSINTSGMAIGLSLIGRL
jgi:hypothetical protein